MAAVIRRCCLTIALLAAAELQGVTPATGDHVPRQLDGRIQIVWPHGGADILSADKANIAVYLFQKGTLKPFCETRIGVSLRVATNNDVSSYLRLPGVGAWQRRTVGNVSLVAWDFNDVDVSFARNPDNRLYFAVREFVMGTRETPDPVLRSNVWAHGADARTYYPEPEIPTGTYPAISPGVVRLAPKMQVVWPHDREGKETAVTGADLANISVAIFHKEGLASVSVPPDHSWPVQLYQALNQEVHRPVATGHKRLVTVNDITYPVWDFNGIDVSGAKDPHNKYFFWVHTTGSEGSNIWVHGADGRTYFPTMDTPEQGCP